MTAMTRRTLPRPLLLGVPKTAPTAFEEQPASAVIDMRSWKASHVPKAQPASRPAGEMLYFCTACDSERFRIFESGAVRCADCDAELRRTSPSTVALSVLSVFLPFGRWWYAPSSKA